MSGQVPPPSGTSKLDSPSHTTTILELKVSARSVGLYPPPPHIINSDLLAVSSLSHGPPPPGTSSSPDDICLLSGPLQRFLSFSRQEHSKWLIDIGHDICDPAAMRGSLSVWNEATRSWRPVAPTDPLIASTYMYSLPPGTIVGLTKISARSGKSATDATGNATMADCVKRRDTMCWVTGARGPLVSSYVCPKRMGDHLAWRVLHDFESAAPAPTLASMMKFLG
ncbi:hypothetical protein FB451DRAFT_1183622 [Mycena latifolia]|nr:hypothetical protein FB451DRAFT_1183622 [Mycena latifolia]